MSNGVVLAVVILYSMPERYDKHNPGGMVFIIRFCACITNILIKNYFHGVNSIHITVKMFCGCTEAHDLFVNVEI